jgi:hypothetical protein
MTNKSETFNNVIRKLFLSNNDFAYKNNLTMLNLFYGELNNYKNVFNLNLDTNEYLYSFETPNEITPSNIENRFSTILMKELFQGKTPTILDNDLKNSRGLYFLYDSFGNILYIGKSNNLFNRVLKSFFNKIPYGVTQIKIIEMNYLTPELLSDFESSLIYYYKPIYNNTNEDISHIKNEKYDKIIEFVKRLLSHKQMLDILPYLYENHYIKKGK